MASIRRKLVLGSFYKLISSGIVVLLSVITSVVINRVYGIQQYGLLIMVFTVTGFLFRFTDLGAKATIYRLLPKMEKESVKASKISRVVFAGMFFVFAGSVIFSLLIYFLKDIIAAYYKRVELVPLLIAGAGYLFAFSLVDFMFSVYQSFQDWLKESVFTILYPALYLGLIFAGMFFLKMGIITVLYANMVAAVITCALAIFSLRGRLRPGKVTGDVFYSVKSYYRKFITFGLPLILPELSSMLVIWTDKFLLGRYAGAEGLSLYYIAFMLSSGLMIVIKIPFTVSLPHTASLVSKEEIQKNYSALFKINIYLSIGVSLVSFILVSWGIKLLYGPGYENAAFAFKLMLPEVFLKAAMLTPYTFLRNVFEKVKVINLWTLFSAVLDVGLCILLVPHYGVIGAIAAINITRLFHLAGVLGFVSSVREITPFSSLFRSVVFMLILGGLYFVMKNLHLGAEIIVLPVLVAVYAGMLFITRELDFLYSSLRRSVDVLFGALGIKQ